MDIAKIILKFWRPRPNGYYRDFAPARRYWLRRVTRNPRRPCRSIIRCQEANSSTVRWYRSHASVREISPARTANTNCALRLAPQRRVFAGGRDRKSVVWGKSGSERVDLGVA